MDKLIITVTVDSSMSYPGNPLMPPIEDVETIGAEYVRSVNAGASIVHHHGIHYLEHEMQADGRRLSRIDFDGWRNLTELIRSECDPIVQFGIASARLDEKIGLMELRPEMMSYAFNPHDEFFQPDPAYPANEMYALHPRDELETFCRAAKEHGVKTEIECFYTGAYWNMQFIRRLGLLDDPIWATIFLGWQGRLLDPADPRRAPLHGSPPAARRELEPERDGFCDAVEAARGRDRARRPCPRRLGRQPLPPGRDSRPFERRARRGGRSDGAVGRP